MNLVICEGIISKAAPLGVRPSYINRCSLVQSLSSCAARHFVRSSLMACACSFLRLLLSFTRSLLPCGLRWIWVFVSWCALVCFGYLFLSIARKASRLFNCPPCCKLYQARTLGRLQQVGLLVPRALFRHSAGRSDLSLRWLQSAARVALAKG